MGVRLLCLLICAVMVLSPVTATAEMHGGRSTEHAVAADCPGHAPVAVHEITRSTADAARPGGAEPRHGQDPVGDGAACSQACELACALVVQLGSTPLSGPYLPGNRQIELPRISLTHLPGPSSEGPFRPPRVFPAH